MTQAIIVTTFWLITAGLYEMMDDNIRQSV